MSRVLSQEEIKVGIQLIDTIATKLDAEILEASNRGKEFKNFFGFNNLVGEYSVNKDVSLMNRPKKLNDFVQELLNNHPFLSPFAGTRYSSTDYRNLLYMSSPEVFNASFYDVAELTAVNEFTRLMDIVYTTNNATGYWEYKHGNELGRYYNITANILELMIDEDPENFYEEKECPRTIEPTNNINSTSAHPS